MQQKYVTSVVNMAHKMATTAATPAATRKDPVSLPVPAERGSVVGLSGSKGLPQTHQLV